MRGLLPGLHGFGKTVMFAPFVPADAGTQSLMCWIPACAGMSGKKSE
jgi:hypothetical protein